MNNKYLLTAYVLFIILIMCWTYGGQDQDRSKFGKFRGFFVNYLGYDEFRPTMAIIILIITFTLLMNFMAAK